MSLSFPSSEHTSYSIRLLPSLSSSPLDSPLDSPPESPLASPLASASEAADPDPGETWSGPRFADPAERDLAAPLAPPPAPPLAARPSRRAAPSARTPPPIPRPAPRPAPRLAPRPAPRPAPQRAKAPELAGLIPVDPLPAAPRPARLVAVVCGALLLTAVTAFVSQYFFTYLFRLL
jgi:hypothetical protein